jgi:hypothetical protein
MELKLFTIAGNHSSTFVLCWAPVACSFVCCVMAMFVLFLLIIALSFLLRLTEPLKTIDSVAASLQVVTFYQVEHIRSHKFKNMQSAERYKLHMHVLLEC